MFSGARIIMAIETYAAVPLHSQSEKNMALELFKFLFIIGVVLFHVHGYFGDPFKKVFGLAYTWGGGAGNVFFWISSGFMMSWRYFDKISRSNPLPFKTFFMKRMISIYPLYFVTNVIQYIVNLIRSGNPTFDLSQLFLSLIFVNEGWIGKVEPPNFSTWFICVLVPCYIVFLLYISSIEK